VRAGLERCPWFAVLDAGSAVRDLVHVETVQTGWQPLQRRREHETVSRFGDRDGTRSVTNAVGIDQVHRHDQLGIVRDGAGKHTEDPRRGQAGRNHTQEISHDVLPLALISR